MTETAAADDPLRLDRQVCFNLSAAAQKRDLAGLPDGAAVEPVSRQAVLSGQGLQLGANGYAFIALDADRPVHVA